MGIEKPQDSQNGEKCGAGKKYSRYPENMYAIAAIDPVCITEKIDQP